MRNKSVRLNNTVFDFIYEMALADATRRVLKDSGSLSECQNVRKTVKKYADDVVNGKEPDFYKVANDVVEKARTKNAEFNFGHAQKLINMTMKYLYIRYCEESDIRERFVICHAPMDSFMRDYVYKRYRQIKKKSPSFPSTIAWSKITDKNIDSYKNYQTAIQEILKTENRRRTEHIMPIEFDYLAWKKDVNIPLGRFK